VYLYGGTEIAERERERATASIYGYIKYIYTEREQYTYYSPFYISSSGGGGGADPFCELQLYLWPYNMGCDQWNIARRIHLWP